MRGESMYPVFRPVGGSDFRRWLKEIEERYADAFAELGPGAVADFKRVMDSIDAFLDLLADPKTDFRVKLMDYTRTRDDVFEFCRYYARLLGNSLAERLKAEIYEVVEEAVSWWYQQLEVVE